MPRNLVLLLLFAAPVVAAEPSLKEARTRWLKGNYAEAATAYEDLSKDDKPAAAAIIGWSRALQSQGEYDKALEVVEKGLTKRDGDPDLFARKAEMLYLCGRWTEAEKAADLAIDKKSENFLARWVKAELLRDRGDLEKADIARRWLVKAYKQRSDDDKDIKDPEELALVGRAGTENANAHGLTDQFDFILNTMYKDALTEEPNAWFVEYQAGQLLLEKYNRGEALDAFDKALKINPRAAEALVGKAVAALQKFEVKEAEELADQALKINPKLTSALRVKMDLMLLGGDLRAVKKLVDEALAINPRDEYTLGRVAALHILSHDRAELEKLIQEVTKFDPKPGRFYYELAERVEERRLFGQAEQYYKKAVEAHPEMPWPRNGLGLLYMRMGKEKEAGELLDKAFEADKFNVRVANSRKVLKHLEKYKTIKTDHFILKYDPEKDSLLARFMADYLEKLYADYCGQFAYKPKEPILVEVFNSHEYFSGRTVALPDLHTIGACTGKMFAMVSPKGKGIRKPFNWGRVLRHELVHIFNLEQTDMQVPHWLTEGLAVDNEGIKHPPDWNRALVERCGADTLLNLDNITLGFVRPRTPDEWSLAYCQSHHYVTFVKKTYGDAAIGKLLGAYAEGVDDATALKKSCNVEKADFEKAYKQYIQAEVKGLQVNKPVAKPMTLTQLQAEYEKKPDDPDIAAKLAERLMSREAGKARKLAEAVLEKQKDHALATVVVAKLDAKGGKLADAIKALEGVIKKDKPDLDVLMAMGQLLVEDSQAATAAEVFEQGRKADPNNVDWLIELAKLYRKGDDKAKRISVIRDLVAVDPDEFELRKVLCQLLLDSGMNEEAEKAARDALEIDLSDEEVQDVLLKSLKAQKKDEEAARLKKLLQD
jgi:tetratricopeptide (TPR) repeat protein